MARYLTEMIDDRPQTFTMHDLEIDRSQTKNEIRDRLLSRAKAADYFLSKSKANNLADKYKKGLYDSDLQYLLSYQDPVGEEATHKALEPEICQASTETVQGRLVRCGNPQSTARVEQWHTQYPFCDYHLAEFIAQTGN